MLFMLLTHFLVAFLIIVVSFYVCDDGKRHSDGFGGRHFAMELLSHHQQPVAFETAEQLIEIEKAGGN